MLPLSAYNTTYCTSLICGTQPSAFAQCLHVKLKVGLKNIKIKEKLQRMSQLLMKVNISKVSSLEVNKDTS